MNHKIDRPPFAINSRVFFGDYGGISAYGGRAIPAFMHSVKESNLAISVALFRFKPGTQELLKGSFRKGAKAQRKTQRHKKLFFL